MGISAPTPQGMQMSSEPAFKEVNFLDLGTQQKSPLYSFMKSFMSGTRNDIPGAQINNPSLGEKNTLFNSNCSNSLVEFVQQRIQQLSAFPSSMLKRDTSATPFPATPGIMPFDETSFTEYKSTGDESTVLVKRKRGRPRKDPSLKKKPKKIEAFPDGTFIHALDPGLLPRSSTFKTKIGAEFKSDSESVDFADITFTETTLNDVIPTLRFGKQGILEIESKSKLEQKGKDIHRLYLSKLLKAIEDEENRTKVKTFICRFCGKTFDKPSSLGGHTAKKHNGLSRKYRKRLDAAKNRKTERDRNNFIKKKLIEELKPDND